MANGAICAKPETVLSQQECSYFIFKCHDKNPYEQFKQYSLIKSKTLLFIALVNNILDYPQEVYWKCANS